MNYLIGSDWQKRKAEHCDEYRKVLNLAGQHARVSRRHIACSDTYTQAIEELAYLNERIDWDLPSDRHKRAMFDINRGCVGNVTFKRIMYHRNPERVKLLIHSLMRDENDVPRPVKSTLKPLKGSLAVHVHKKRKPIKLGWFTL